MDEFNVTETELDHLAKCEQELKQLTKQFCKEWIEAIGIG